ncbi:MAG: hypothetical protein H6733_09105 [Alphaproteobacteria bacterium]|nr:hypothetical protein [Alphaproteobacteria bacterium]
MAPSTSIRPVTVALGLALTGALVLAARAGGRGCAGPGPRDFGEPQAEERILLVGNSFTSANALGDQLAHLVACARGDDVLPYVEVVAPDGGRLAERVGDDAVATALARDAFATVVLQEQSQIPALPRDTPPARTSRAAVAALHGRIRRAGAETVLFATWGYRAGDPAQGARGGSFDAMQDALTAGYEALRDATDGQARVAPVGEAFRAVQQLPRRDGDGAFDALYAADDKHPSPAGSYLAAAVLTATITGRPTQACTWRPGGVPDALAATLRQVADRAVLPWSERSATDSDR